MEVLKIEKGYIYTTMMPLCDRGDKFKIVKKIPKDFFIWNIGDMGTDDWLPICEDLNKDDKDDYSINPSTLKTIKLPKEEVYLLMRAAEYGVTCKKDALKALKSNPRSSLRKRKKEYAEKTIDIFKRISE